MHIQSLTQLSCCCVVALPPLTGRRYPIVRLDTDTVWGARVCIKLGDLVTAARPFLQQQRSANHFAHLGCDFIVDEDGEPWLLEINAPPCLGSQSGRSEDDDAVGALLVPQLDAIIATFVVPYALPSDGAVLLGSSTTETGTAFDDRRTRKRCADDDCTTARAGLSVQSSSAHADARDDAMCDASGDGGGRGRGGGGGGGGGGVVGGGGGGGVVVGGGGDWLRVLCADPSFHPSNAPELARNTELWDTCVQRHVGT
jgi:uncharacterized membrane protein YgcG